MKGDARSVDYSSCTEVPMSDLQFRVKGAGGHDFALGVWHQALSPHASWNSRRNFSNHSFKGWVRQRFSGLLNLNPKPQKP